MGYVDRNLVPGETLAYVTRHHWLVLVGPLIGAVLLLLFIGAQRLFSLSPKSRLSRAAAARAGKPREKSGQTLSHGQIYD